jgi:hypothetical protein
MPQKKEPTERAKRYNKCVRFWDVRTLKTLEAESTAHRIELGLTQTQYLEAALRKMLEA